MTGAQEQNFLIGVAARDDMRLAFRSQLELLKAVREDKDASGSPTFIRTKTLTALGLGGALVPSGLKEKEVEASFASTSVWQNIGAAFKRPAVSITAGLLAGVLGTAFFMPHSAQETGVPAGKIISAPAVQAPVQIAPAPLTAEPAKDQPSRSVSNHVPTTPVHHQAVSQTNPTVPVLNTQVPGKVENNNTIHKPEDPGKK